LTASNEFEKKLYSLGFKAICGIDEAGRGPIAGPVVAAAVILKPDFKAKGLNDSKTLSAKKRQKMLKIINDNALAVGICFVSPQEIDQINILRATKKAMGCAIEQLKLKPDFILADFVDLTGLTKIPFESLVKGDSRSISIAAASIVAKETRDSYMSLIDKFYPEYGFKTHKGYPTKTHLKALKKYGVTPIHRQTFKPVKQVIEKTAI
jgi:ribonuclease HII